MSATTDTIFGKILDGEIPCHRVYEDEHAFAFLDVGPLSRGHTLVIPRERVAGLHELTPEAAAGVGRALSAVAAAVMKATGVTAYNVLLNTGAPAGQEVMHAHFHIIPKHDDGTGLRKQWTPGTLDAAEAEQLATDIRAAIG